MGSNNADLQDRLHEYYTQQLRRYEELMTHIQRMNESVDDSNDAVVHVKSLLNEISVHENASDSLRQEWRSVGSNPSSQLKETVERVKTLVQKLIETVSHTERQVVDAQNKLRPELAIQATRRKIAAAYKTR